MAATETRAINALWHTSLQSADEKLMLYHLASRHELGERYSSSWKGLEAFLADFEDRWCNEKELAEATRLSPDKVSSILQNLHERGYIKKGDARVQRDLVLSRRRSGTTPAWAITPKLFAEYAERADH